MQLSLRTWFSSGRGIGFVVAWNTSFFVTNECKLQRYIVQDGKDCQGQTVLLIVPNLKLQKIKSCEKDPRSIKQSHYPCFLVLMGAEQKPQITKMALGSMSLANESQCQCYIGRDR